MAKPTIILVPGAWHLPAHYEPLTDILAAPPYSFPVKALKMPSVDSHPPQSTRQPDIDHVRAAILDAIETTESGDVWILMHSYGGVPGSEGVQGLSKEERKAQGLKGGVSRLIYMAAFLCPEGVGMTEIKNYPGHVQWAVPKEDDTGNLIVPDPAPVFYQDCNEAMTKHAIGMLKTHSVGSLAEPAKHAPWTYMPSLYIFCEEDMGMIPDFQHSMISQKEGWLDSRNGWSMVKIPSGHSPFMSMPGRVAEEVEKYWTAYSA